MNKKIATLFAGCGGKTLGAIAATNGIPIWAIEYDPEIADLYRNNISTNIIVKNILNIDPKTLESPNLLLISPPCFPTGVTVLTNKGLKNIESIEIGDLVVTHKGRLRPVTNLMSRQSKTVKVEGLGHWGLEVTPNHPFLATEIKTIYPPYKERKKGNYSTKELTPPHWEDAHNMLGKHWLALTEYPDLEIPEIEYTRRESARGQVFDFSNIHFWQIVGCWVGDGWIRYSEGKCNLRNRGTVFICSDKNDSKNLEEKLIASGIKYGKSMERTTIRFSISSRPLCRWLSDNFSLGSANKSLPTWLLGCSYEIKKAFFDGYMSADGHTSHPSSFLNPVISSSTVSKNLAITLRMLGVSLGYSVSLKLYGRKRDMANIEGRIVNEKPSYCIRFSMSQRHARIIKSDSIYSSGCVRKISDCCENQVVYDITVAEDESFIADGIVVHNCPNFSAAKVGRVETDNDRALADKICEFITTLYPEEILIENVRGYRQSESYATIIDRLTTLGYYWDAQVFNFADFGVPQTRERLIVRASRIAPIPIVIPTHAKNPVNTIFNQQQKWVGWHEAIADLIPSLPRCELANWQKLRMESRNVPELALIERSGARSEMQIRGADRPSFTLRAMCGKIRPNFAQANILVSGQDATQRQCGDPSFVLTAGHTVNRIMLSSQPINNSHRNGDEPSLTLAANKTICRILEDAICYRVSTPALARLQTFPDWYQWSDREQVNVKAIGNSVPCLAAEKIIKSFSLNAN